ncbi:M23 family metallopeptidase [Streptomyces sp. NPDC058751]|uniref:M23 family metallopeptidase n=1 Tax=Streptomyces sp. NPDC058751 TaxID=3346623 RepID=UPI0036A6FB2F
MASNRPAQPTPFAPNETHTFGYGKDEGPWEEWNPTADSVAPVRGRHRTGKQRSGGGGLARSSTVLGVGVIAAVGGGGIASASPDQAPVSISMPDLSSVTESAKALVTDGGSSTPQGSTTPLTTAGLTSVDEAHGATDAGEALRDRIMQQAQSQQNRADTATQKAAQTAAAQKAVQLAAKQQDEAEAKAAAVKEKAEEAAKEKAEAERLAELAKSYALPTSSYTLTSTFGEAGALWSSGYHTGLDFAAPTGTLLKAVHSGTVTEAGWAGAYGYRTVLTLDDGTELWYAHQSSISVTVGQKVATGDVIGRVGATGNVTGAHLHFEVHPGGAATGIDPTAWLQSKGINP